MSKFDPKIVEGVLAHMNDDHNDDSLLIARAFGRPEATISVMKDLDGTGGIWTVTDPEGTSDLHVPWSQTITERPEIRREVVVLYDEACRRLGIEPRPH